MVKFHTTITISLRWDFLFLHLSHHSLRIPRNIFFANADAANCAAIWLVERMKTIYNDFEEYREKNDSISNVGHLRRRSTFLEMIQVSSVMRWSRRHAPYTCYRRLWANPFILFSPANRRAEKLRTRPNFLSIRRPPHRRIQQLMTMECDATTRTSMVVKWKIETN